jgi:tetratricopeptide (TPR) repeat protein
MQIKARMGAVTGSRAEEIFCPSTDDSHSYPPALSQAWQSYQNGDLVKAETVCQTLIACIPQMAEPLSLLGLIAQKQGNLDLAQNRFEQAIRLDPGNPLNYCNLGGVLHDRQKYPESIRCYRKALQIRPDMTAAYYDMGNSFNRLKGYPEAIGCYQKALELKPDFVEAIYNLGNCYMDLNRFDEAATCYRQAIQIDADFVAAYFNLAISCAEVGQKAQAIACYQQALTLKPNMVEAHYNLGLLFQEKGDWEEAVACYRRALRLNPNFVAAYNNLGSALQEQGKLEAALPCYRQALQLNPDYADAHYNLGRLYHEINRLPEAAACYQKSLRIRPDYYKACNNLGKAYQDRLQLDQALDWYRQALRIKPDYAEAHFNLATAHLLAGNLLEGWHDYEWRFKREGWQKIYPHRLAKPRWQGEPFAQQTLLVHGEQGLGDIIQFVRYLPMVKALGGKVIFEGRESLNDLLKNLAGVDKLTALSADSPPAEDEFDLCVPLLSLPGIFRTKLETIPAAVPYIKADRAKSAHWKDRLKYAGPKVGLVWVGTATDPRRACPLEKFVPVSRIPGIQLYGLQKGPEAERLKAVGLPEGLVMRNLGDEFRDFADTAAAVENLDLVISIDTAVAHLAGALGKPVWLLLPYTPDWRWLLQRSDSPWYPTMRLFRQPQPGDWDSVLQAVALKLKSFTGAG